jgi:hypothetical protein
VFHQRRAWIAISKHRETLGQRYFSRRRRPVYRDCQSGDVAKEIGLRVDPHAPILSLYRIRVNAIRERLTHCSTTRPSATLDSQPTTEAIDDLEINTLRLPSDTPGCREPTSVPGCACKELVTKPVDAIVVASKNQISRATNLDRQPLPARLPFLSCRSPSRYSFDDNALVGSVVVVDCTVRADAPEASNCLCKIIR